VTTDSSEARTDAAVRWFAALGAGVLTWPFIFAGAMALKAYLVFAQGYVLAEIWQWYAVPLGLPELGWHTGMAVVLGWQILRAKNDLTPERSTGPEPTRREQVTAFLGPVAQPWLALLVAWVLR
jgi:hypothetical protein